ncbi:hypothetical protein OC846_000932 [Tilletia horrida]|uniref:Nucleoporin Nup133/Nup155-like C-terminal domain-containing protein n=1 Tax=Tilletia horrida TaxID=155126 RepID=A0AAN6JTF7_9BASI|nr:hypothetical protein OC845_000842 [Tilletia horrida]KAK0556744.1 hypothetical protein OC846_000932 [Tilletia horrida]
MYASPIPNRIRRTTGAARTGRVSGSPAFRASAGPAGLAGATTQQLPPGAPLLQDGVTSVTVNSALPIEVKQELANADPYADPFSGFIDSNTNYAGLVTRRKILIWNHLPRGALPSTCFRLALEPVANNTDALPLVALASSPSGREPGAIVVFPNGAISFVESVAAAEHVQDGQQLNLALVPNEAVTAVRRHGNFSFTIATSHSRLFRLSILLQDGRRVAQAAPFVHSKSLLGRLFGSSSTYGLSSEPILSLALGEASGVNLLYALSPSSVQRWNMVEGGVDSLAAEQEVRSLILTAVLQSHGAAEGGQGSSSVSLLDCAVTSDGGIAILYAERNGSSAPVSSGIAVLSYNAATSSLAVTTVKPLRGVLETDSRSEYSPRLAIPNGGKAAFVVLPSSLTVCLLDSDFEFQISLKNPDRSRIFANGFPTGPTTNPDSAGVALLTTATPPLLVHLSLAAAREQDAKLANAEDKTEVATESLQSFVRQAVIYGQQHTNPLAFKLPAAHEGDLSVAVERLSDDFVTTDAEGSAVMDVRAYLASKKERLAALIAFVRQSGQLGNIPAPTRRKLCADAELVDAAIASYLAHDAGLRTQSYVNLLGQAIAAVVQQQQLDPQEDVIRTFFRKYLILLPLVFTSLNEALQSAASSDVAARTQLISEANHIILAAYIAGTRRRELSSKHYDLPSVPVAFESWSFETSGLELLTTLYHATERLIGDRTREYGSAVDVETAGGASANSIEEARRIQRELKTQLCDLAEYTLGTFEDRQLFLLAEGNNLNEADDYNRLERRYKTSRPRMILPLVAVGRRDKAFQLAERYSDYQTLTKLCQEAAEGPLGDRADSYVHRYGKDFAFELYAWHIEHDRIRDLLLLGEKQQQSGLLHAYLEQTGNTRLAWLQQVQMKQFADASTSLLQTAKVEPDLRSRKLMLSISKLAYAAQLEGESLVEPEALAPMNAISENMEMVATQVRLLAKLKTYLAAEPEGDVGEAVREVTQLAASRLEIYPAFATLFAQACKKLWVHEAVTSEELIDLFTLRDCADDEVTSYISALDVYVRATEDPATRRKDYLRSIWRRIILRDDWALIADTEGVDDDTIQANLRRTALYYVLKTINSRTGYEPATVEPNEFGIGPSLESLRGRFENMPEQYLKEVQADYQTETSAVSEVMRLYEAWVDQVRRLVIQDDEDEAAEESARAEEELLVDEGHMADDEEEALDQLDELSADTDTVMDD